MADPILDAFGFSRLPFGKSLSAKEVFASQMYKEAYSRLHYGIGEEDLLVLTGPVGCGKSVVLNALIRSLDANRYLPLYIRATNLSDVELYKNILSGLDHPPPYLTHLARRLFYQVVEQCSRKPIVILDDAQDAQESTFRALKALVNFGFDTENRITFILSGQPELKAILKLSHYLALKQRVRLYFHMQGLGVEETCRYIDHHTKLAGRPSPLFSDEAKMEIHRASEGIPRRVNSICYRSILSAALEGLRIIDSNNLALEDLTE